MFTFAVIDKESYLSQVRETLIAGEINLSGDKVNDKAAHRIPLSHPAANVTPGRKLLLKKAL